MNRSEFLTSACALALLPKQGQATQGKLVPRAETITAQVLPQGNGTTPILGFDGSMPGPEIRLPRRQRISIDLKSGLLCIRRVFDWKTQL